MTNNWIKIPKPTGNEGVVGYCFVVCDLLHIGHLHFFEKCKGYCDFLIVGVYTDELTEKYKRRPIIPFEQRIAMVMALKPVNAVVEVNHKDATSMLKKLTEVGWKISFLFHGDDWKNVKGRRYIKSIGGKLIQPKYLKGMDATSIINKIRRRYKCK